MAASEARILANRQNASRSTGPRTAEGKERSRGNALKHGLTGAGVVLPNEDAAEVDRRFSAFQDELKPSGEVGRALVQRAALLSVRMERCVSQETATLSVRVRRAEADFVAPEGLDGREVARLRAEEGCRAMFDPSKEATLARKYEAAAERGFFRALKELRQLEARAREDDPALQAEAYRDQLGSFLSHEKMDAEFDEMWAASEAEELRLAVPLPSRGPLPASKTKFSPLGDSFELPITIGRPR
jgi:hypothetical protein